MSSDFFVTVMLTSLYSPSLVSGGLLGRGNGRSSSFADPRMNLCFSVTDARFSLFSDSFESPDFRRPLSSDLLNVQGISGGLHERTGGRATGASIGTTIGVKINPGTKSGGRVTSTGPAGFCPGYKMEIFKTFLYARDYENNTTKIAESYTRGTSRKLSNKSIIHRSRNS